MRGSVSGDFNVHMDNKSDTFTMEFLNLLNFINFTQHVMKMKMKKTRLLKRKCRKAERRWRKDKLTVNYQIFREHLNTYNKAIKDSRHLHFSKLIT